ncbi:hypothetical protein AB0P40_02160 [Streptomyces sp. NPDC079189]|uniref:hypothetical protein n=1 Tax=Streptomyces sp. NPDC079189 TaxID=3154514 RepID=UPI00342C25BD
MSARGLVRDRGVAAVLRKADEGVALVSSALRPQRSLVAVQSTRQMHTASCEGGSHFAGSFLPFDRLLFAVTATRERSA